MPRAHPEQLLISAVLRTQDMKAALKSGLSDAHFTAYKIEWAWIVKHYEKHGALPSRAAFRAKFPACTVYKTDDIDAHADDVKQEFARTRLTEIMDDSIEAMMKGNIALAMTDMQSELLMLQATVADVDGEYDLADDWDSTFQDVCERVERVKQFGRSGIPTGFTTMDEVTGGLQPGWLVIPAARLGQGKMLADTTKVLTPVGWTLNGDLTVGDLVIGSDGEPTEVLAVYPHKAKTVFEVTFSDGSVIEAGEDHLWTVRIGAKPYRVWSTTQIMEHLEAGNQRPAVPTMQPWKCPIADLPLDPYLLGLLLGDGCLSHHKGSVVFSSADQQLVDCFGDSATHYSGYDYGIRGLTNILRSLGLLHHKSEDKFVPDAYLYASAEQRHALLQGLLDTDGGPTATGGVEFSSTSRSLAEAVQFLAESLGGHAHWHDRQTYCNGKPGLPSHRMIVVLPSDFPPFRLIRKHEKWVPRTKYKPARTIVSVVKTDRKTDMTCITVDAADSLYVTEHCIVTHNTWTMISMAVHAAMSGYTSVYWSLEQSRHQIAMRSHTLMSASYGKEVFRALDLQKGTGFDLKGYKDFLNDLKSAIGGKFIVNDTKRGRVSPMTVAAGIERSEADIAFVDYLTLMEQKGDGGWLSVGQLSADLKNIAEAYKVPICAASQINRTGVGTEPPDVDTLSRSDSIGQDADLVITMSKKSESVMKMKLAKNRHGPDGVMWFAEFKPGQGIFREVDGDRAGELIEQDQEAP